MFFLVYSGDHNHMHIFISLETSVLDPDLDLRGGGLEGGRTSRLLGKGGAVSKKNFSVWSKNGGGGQAPGAPPVDLDPPLNLPV